MDNYLDDHDHQNTLLERFRAKYRELSAAQAPVHLYAVVDQGGLTPREREAAQDLAARQHSMSLYAGSGLDALEAVGPVLLTMPDPRSVKSLADSSFLNTDSNADMFLRLLSLAQQHVARVTWIWTPHDMNALVEHLQTLLYARLGTNGEDAWFFFYHPSHLKILHERLPEATRRYVFGPVHAWWTLDIHGELVELAGEGSHVPHPWDELPVPDDVVAALQREAMPAQVQAWLQQTRMSVATGQNYNYQMAQIAPLVERAFEHGLNRPADVVTFVAYGLRYRIDYDQHPQLDVLLADTAALGSQLAPAYRRVERAVWHNLAQNAQQRVQAQTERKRHDELKKIGHIRLSAQIVNVSGTNLRDVYFDLYGKRREDRQFIGGAIDSQMSREVALLKEDLLSPLPGEKLVLHWDDVTVLQGGTVYREHHERELTVEGEVPPANYPGLLEVRFEKYAQRIVMYRDEDAWSDARRGEQ